MSFLNLSKFVKRFFVFDLDDKRAIMYFTSSSSTDKPNDVIPLGSLLAVRREDQTSGPKEYAGGQSSHIASSQSFGGGAHGSQATGSDGTGSKADGAGKRRSQNRSIQLTASEKPRDGWIHVLEIQTNKRVFRLFSDSYDVKEQWFFALNQICLHKEFIEQQHKLMIAESVKIESAMPSNSQDTSTYDLQAEPVTVGRASSSTSLVMSSARRQHESEQALETNMGIKQFVQKSHGPSFIDPASIARQRQEEEEARGGNDDRQQHSPEFQTSYRKLLNSLSQEGALDNANYEDAAAAAEVSVKADPLDASPKNMAIQDIDPSYGGDGSPIYAQMEDQQQSSSMTRAQSQKRSRTGQTKSRSKRRGRNTVSAKTSVKAIARPDDEAGVASSGTDAPASHQQEAAMTTASKLQKNSNSQMIYPGHVDSERQSQVVADDAEDGLEDGTASSAVAETVVEPAVAVVPHPASSAQRKAEPLLLEDGQQSQSPEHSDQHRGGDLQELQDESSAKKRQPREQQNLASPRGTANNDEEEKEEELVAAHGQNAGDQPEEDDGQHEYSSKEVTAVIDLLGMQRRIGEHQIKAKKLQQGEQPPSLPTKKGAATSLPQKQKSVCKPGKKTSLQFAAARPSNFSVQPIKRRSNRHAKGEVHAIIDDRGSDLSSSSEKAEHSRSPTGDGGEHARFVNQNRAHSTSLNQVLDMSLSKDMQSKLQERRETEIFKRNQIYESMLKKNQQQQRAQTSGQRRQTTAQSSMNKNAPLLAYNDSMRGGRNLPLVANNEFSIPQMQILQYSVQQSQSQLQPHQQPPASQLDNAMLLIDTSNNQHYTALEESHARARLDASSGQEVLDDSEMYSNKSLSEAIRERLFSPAQGPSSCEFLHSQHALNAHPKANSSQLDVRRQPSSSTPLWNVAGAPRVMEPNAANSGMRASLGGPATTMNQMLQSKSSLYGGGVSAVSSTNSQGTAKTVIKLKKKSVGNPNYDMPEPLKRLMRNSNSSSHKTSAEQINASNVAAAADKNQPGSSQSIYGAPSQAVAGASTAQSVDQPAFLSRQQLMGQNWSFKTQDRRAELLQGEQAAQATVSQLLEKQRQSQSGGNTSPLKILRRPGSSIYKRSQVKVVGSGASGTQASMPIQVGSAAAPPNNLLVSKYALELGPQNQTTQHQSHVANEFKQLARKKRHGSKPVGQVQTSTAAAKYAGQSQSSTRNVRELLGDPASANKTDGKMIYNLLASQNSGMIIGGKGGGHQRAAKTAQSFSSFYMHEGAGAAAAIKAPPEDQHQHPELPSHLQVPSMSDRQGRKAAEPLQNNEPGVTTVHPQQRAELEMTAGQQPSSTQDQLKASSNSRRKSAKKQIKHAFSATMSQISVQDAPKRVTTSSLNRLKSMEMNDVTVTLVDECNNEGSNMMATSGSFFYGAAGKEEDRAEQQDLSMMIQNNSAVKDDCEEKKSPYLVVPTLEDSMYRVSQRSGCSAGNQGSNCGDNDQSGSKLSDWS